MIGGAASALMGLYLYCIAPSGHEPATDQRGLDGQRVRALRIEPFAVWASELDAPPEPSAERILAHHAVVEVACRAAATPLPIRFGQWVSGRPELEQRMAERRAAYEAALRQVAGAIELGVHVLDPAAEPEAALAAADGGAFRSGRAYLEALAQRSAAERARDARGQQLAGTLREEAGAVVRAERVEPLRSPRGLVSIVHLVARTDVEEYRSALERVRAAHRELKFLVSGPWPPYSFVE